MFYVLCDTGHLNTDKIKCWKCKVKFQAFTVFILSIYGSHESLIGQFCFSAELFDF